MGGKATTETVSSWMARTGKSSKQETTAQHVPAADKSEASDELSDLTKEEWAVVMQHHASTIIMTLQHQLASTATLMNKMELVDYNIGRSATLTASIISSISALQLVLGPMVGSLSDRFGRKPLMFTSTFGQIIWNIFNASSLCSSPDRYAYAAALCHGVLSAGSMTVRGASLDDEFGNRSLLGAKIRAKTAFWTSAVGFVGPILGAELSRRNRRAAFCLAAALAALQLPITALSKETLRRSDRSSFKFMELIRKSNPLENVMILFRSGSPLRRRHVPASTEPLASPMDSLYKVKRAAGT